MSNSKIYGAFTSLIIMILCICAGMVQAQTPSFTTSYTCSFEESEAAEVSQWHFAPGDPDQWRNYNDMWWVGTARASEGVRSLYISNDSAVNAQFGFRRNVVVAYREITFPAGRWVISFDWMNEATENSGLYMYLITGNTPPSDVQGSSTIPSWSGLCTLTKADGTVVSDGRLQGTGDKWETAFYEFPRSLPQPTKFYLAFVWQNDRTDSVPNTLGACVDNIQIRSNACPYPVNLTANASCDVAELSWESLSSYAENYSVEYRPSGSQRWTVASPMTTVPSYRLEGLGEGVYDFRVRGISNAGDTSVYASCNNVLLFCPESHCVNYVELDQSKNPNVECLIGDAGRNNFGTSQAINFGPDEKSSRHTVYWKVGQTDPRTENMLPTIPEGEVASVRLGNWVAGSQAEQIKFTIPQADTSTIILLKYAVVFEEPDWDSHTREEQPYFGLRILDQWGNVVEPGCSEATFYAEDGVGTESGWHMVVNTGGYNVMWKEWTMVGVQLPASLHGQRIVIELTSQDCTKSAHYAYSYFTIGCSPKAILNTSCGDNQPELKAPDGFEYVWCTGFDANGEPTGIVGREQTYLPPVSDGTTYYCRCYFKENRNCYFDLNTVVTQREPTAQFSWKQEPVQCENYVRFTNESFVSIVEADGDTVPTSETTETVEWTIDGNVYGENTPRVWFPAEGDTVDFQLVVGISGNACTDTIKIEDFVIPTILTPTDTIDTTVCHGDGYFFEGLQQMLVRPGQYVANLKNWAECDSIIVVNFDLHPETEDSTTTAHICYGDTLDVEGYKFWQEGRHRVTLANEYGCDYNLYIELSVSDSIEFTYGKKDVEGMPNTGEIVINVPFDGYTYTLNGEENASLTGLSGGDYEIVVYDSTGCASEPVTITINQECAAADLDTVGIYTACADDGSIDIPCNITAGVATNYRIEYGDKARSAGFENIRDTFDVPEVNILLPDSCRPDRYEANVVIEDIICEERVYPLSFEIHYASDIVVQKWDNVLAVKNDRYNGGYSFAAFQWYMNDAPLTGEIGSYYYNGPDVALDTTATYYVMLTRADDGVTLPTCPIVPVAAKPELTAYPVQTVVTMGQKVRIAGVEENDELSVSVWNVSGVYYFSETVDDFSSEVDMPYHTGVYVLVIDDGAEKRHFKIIVR